MGISAIASAHQYYYYIKTFNNNIHNNFSKLLTVLNILIYPGQKGCFLKGSLRKCIFIFTLMRNSAVYKWGWKKCEEGADQKLNRCGLKESDCFSTFQLKGHCTSMQLYWEASFLSATTGKCLSSRKSCKNASMPRMAVDTELRELPWFGIVPTLPLSMGFNFWDFFPLNWWHCCSK